MQINKALVKTIQKIWNSETPTFNNYLKAKSDAAASVNEFAKDLNIFMYKVPDHTTPLRSAIKHAAKKAWRISITDDQAECLTSTLIQWKVYDTLNRKEVG